MAGGECAFCAIVAGGAAAHLVLEEPEVVGFLDRRPVFPGHVLVLPRAHVDTLADLPAVLLVPLFSAVQRVSAVMPDVLGAEGSWVSINNVVSQSVPHLHVHVVPRRKGDGLRGFFWPRTKYADDAEMDAVARSLRAALDSPWM
ncbi:MAG: HIT family protein [Acidimicrobiia bacterium]